MPGLDDASGYLAQYRAERTRTIESEEPGTAATRRLSDLTDTAVSALAEAAFGSLSGRWAVLALGAYGAHRLLPSSDIDLLVLTDRRPDALREPVATLLYPLWDMALEVGHAVRTPKQHARACRDDLHALTATLTARWIAGDPTLASETVTSVTSAAIRRRVALERDLEQRGFPDSAYALEPDLKDGAGGQRDIDELVWRALLAGTGDHAAAPVGLEAAQDRISAARWVLHRSAGRKTAVLDGETAEEMNVDRAALAEARAMAHEALLVARRLLPSDALDPTPWDPATLLGALESGREALDRLECAARRGAIDGIVPGMSHLMTLARPALSHQLTVGAHSLLTAAYIAEASARDSLAARALESVTDRRPLLAAALAHDAGKVVAGLGHASRSAPVARAAAISLGVEPDNGDVAATLASEHLLLAETASSSDIDDEEVILRTAARLGSREILGQLYVLTLADSLATGPGMWDAWHASLVRTLVSRLDGALSDETDGAGLVASAEATRAASLSMAESDAATSRVLSSAPVRFLTSRSPSEAMNDARLLAELGAPGSRGQFALGISRGAVPGTFRLAIATIDRPGIFAHLTGVIALAGLDTLGASAHAGPSGTALDTFTVRPATLASPDEGTWSTLERYLAASLDGHLDLRTRLTERQRSYPPGRPSRARVSIEPPGAYATAVHVSAADRPGLLFDIADEIAAAGYVVTRANALTRGMRARDTFHVVDTDGVAPSDPGALGHLAMRLRARLK